MLVNSDFGVGVMCLISCEFLAIVNYDLCEIILVLSIVGTIYCFSMLSR